MSKRALLALCALLILSTLVVSIGCSAGVSKPTVGSVPAGWTLEDDQPYGTFEDIEGLEWGVLYYLDNDDYDDIIIWYGDVSDQIKGHENDAQALQDYAIWLMRQDWGSSWTPDAQGTMTINGHTAGWVSIYDPYYDTYNVRLVFISGNTCVDIDALYDNDPADEAQVLQLINSITVP